MCIFIINKRTAVTEFIHYSIIHQGCDDGLIVIGRFDQARASSVTGLRVGFVVFRTDDMKKPGQESRKDV